MDIFEDLGGCVMIAVAALVLLLLVIVAVVVLGVVLPNLIG